jgi:transketolase
MKEIVDKLIDRVIDISLRHNLSHLGSCLTAIPILVEIFEEMKVGDKFVLSNGHAGLAYYVVLEHYRGINAEDTLIKYGIHPERDLDLGIDVSTGSLGMGLPIAAGMAMFSKENQVYCLISDGECAEGSIWEALHFIDSNGLCNMHVYVNINGVAAYKDVDIESLSRRLKSFLPGIKIRITDVSERINFPTKLSAHYMSTEKAITLKK